MMADDDGPPPVGSPEDVLKYSYRLDTLFDISTSLFTSVDPELIIKNCLLSTMGNFGMLKGFIALYDSPTRAERHFVSQGFEPDELGAIHRLSGLCLSRTQPCDLIDCRQAPPLPGFTEIEYLLPITADDAVTGFMGLGAKIIDAPYSEEEKRLLITLKNSLSIALKNASSFERIERLNADLMANQKQLEATVSELETAMTRVAEYSRHLEKIISALNVAQEVQQAFLPQHPPAAQGLVQIAGVSLYCDETGGDYFDYVPLPAAGPDTYGIAVGDVSGHGISSALLMASVRAYLRGRATQPGSAAQIISDLNQLVCADTEKTCQFMTLVFLVLESASYCIRWVNAGHDPIYLYDPSSGQLEQLRGAKGVALGVEPGWHFTESSATVRPGQVVILSTDGLVESHNPQKEMFGKDRFKAVVAGAAHLSAEAISAALVESITQFRNGAPQHDDITLVVLKFNA